MELDQYHVQIDDIAQHIEPERHVHRKETTNIELHFSISHVQ